VHLNHGLEIAFFDVLEGIFYDVGQLFVAEGLLLVGDDCVFKLAVHALIIYIYGGL
jgi:hypothetical protein